MLLSSGGTGTLVTMANEESGKNAAAVALGKLRAKQFTSASQRKAIKARWADHEKCTCKKCSACRSRASRARKKAAERKEKAAAESK